MAETVISANYPPHIDPTKTPLAYGDRALPRLVNIYQFIINFIFSCSIIIMVIASSKRAGPKST